MSDTDPAVENPLDELQDLDDPKDLPPTPLEGLPWWLTDKTKQKRAKGRDERAPGHVFHPALASFFSDGWINDVRLLVKSGKEATVYCCAATPSTGCELIAAKVYRPVGVRQ